MRDARSSYHAMTSLAEIFALTQLPPIMLLNVRLYVHALQDRACTNLIRSAELIHLVRRMGGSECQHYLHVYCVPNLPLRLQKTLPKPRVRSPLQPCDSWCLSSYSWFATPIMYRL